VRKGIRLIFLNFRFQTRGLCLNCEASYTEEVFIKAQRRFLLSLITISLASLLVKFLFCDSGIKLVREGVRIVRKVKLCFMWFFYNYY
jgi:hypothetical protein